MANRRSDCPFAHSQLEGTREPNFGSNDSNVAPSIVVNPPKTYQCTVCGAQFIEGAIPECKEMEASA